MVKTVEQQIAERFTPPGPRKPWDPMPDPYYTKSPAFRRGYRSALYQWSGEQQPAWNSRIGTAESDAEDAGFAEGRWFIQHHGNSLQKPGHRLPSPCPISAAKGLTKARGPRSPQEVRADLWRASTSVTEWSRQHNVAPQVVFDLLLGRLAGHRGQAHRAAVLLGLKEGVIDAATEASK